MDRKVLAIILAGGKRQELKPLIKERCKAAVPFFGKFRVIDFLLSNCVNSGIRQINVMVQYKYNSLQKHIRDGWSFLRPEFGQYVDVYPPQQLHGDNWYLGTANAVYQNLYTIKNENPEYVLLLAGDHIYKMDYNKLIDFHYDHNADVTLASVPVPIEDANRFGNLVTDEENRIIEFHEKPEHPVESKLYNDQVIASMGVYVFKTNVLKDIIKSRSGQHGEHEIGRYIIPLLVEQGRAYSWMFVDEQNNPQYWNPLHSMEEYYRGNMDFMSDTPPFDISDNNWPFRTLQIQNPPSKIITQNDIKGEVIDSVIYNGNIIKGKVKNSIIGNNVIIEKGAEVIDSILLNEIHVGKGAKIINAIVDQGVNIPDGYKLGYDKEMDEEKFFVYGDRVVIAKETVIN